MNHQRKEPVCALCGYQCSEVKILNCNCNFHVRCLPVNIFSTYRQAVECRRQDTVNIPCPGCSQKVSGFYINPLSLDDLEEAGRLNRNEHHSDLSEISRKRKRGEIDDEAIVNTYGDNNKDQNHDSSLDNSEEFTSASASPFLLWSNSSSAEKDSNDKLHFRTGRWSSSETNFVELLIQCFDNSTLPLPHGIKLNEFLKDILMCKSSRLTKKMKNAKLSHRNYKFIMATPAIHDIRAVSQAQQNFLDSVPSQVTRLILKFNISRIWRLHFSNLCLQTGYESVMGEDWLQSLEDFDKRVSDAELIVRRYRRERLIKALRSDSFQDSIDGVYVGTPTNRNDVGMIGMMDVKQKIPRITSGVALSNLNSHLPKTDTETTTHTEPIPAFPIGNTPMIEEIDEIEEITPKEITPDCSSTSEIPRDLTITTIKLKEPSDLSRASDNFSIDFLDLDASLSGETYLSLKDTRQSFRKKNIFLSRIMSFLESQSLPIHCIDCWVPSTYSMDQQQSSGQHANQSQPLMRLVHAGDDLRSDLSAIMEYQLHEFGVYSKKFSFDPGAGLPGRCYSSLTCSWENNIQNSSPEHFKRLGGARYAGIKTAIGLPVKYPKIGTIVIGLYSLTNVNYNSHILDMCSREFQRFDPETRWNISIDIPSADSTTFSEKPPSIDSSNHESKSTVCRANRFGSASSHMSERSKESSASNDSICFDQAMEMANLLAEHQPSVEEGEKKSNLIRSLRMQLLNFSEDCSASLMTKLKILWKSYKSYCKVQRKKEDIVKLLVSDWEFMSKGDDEQKTPPWGSKGMTHVNYLSSQDLQKVNTINLKQSEEIITSKVLSANILNFPPALGGSVGHDPNIKLPTLLNPSNVTSESRVETVSRTKTDDEPPHF